jgi:carbamoyltransferase
MFVSISMKGAMLLGLNLSHDSSAALVDNFGVVLSAVSEERISRKKNQISFPRLSIASLGSVFDISQVSTVVVGSHSDFRFANMNSLHWIFEKEHFPKFDGMIDKFVWPPGYAPSPQLDHRSDPTGALREAWVKGRIEAELKELGISANIVFRNHHDAHVFSGIGSAEYEHGLAFSLDGEGDGESGLVKKFWSEDGIIKTHDLARIPNTASLGYLYTAITNRYNFKPTFHEGKITGLASFGEGGKALDFLLTKVHVTNGVPHFDIPSNRALRLVNELIQRTTKRSNLVYSLDNLADLAAKKSTNYPDLAAAVQEVLEISVCKIVEHFIEKTDEVDLTLSGGVFANVKLNQKITEMKRVQKVSVFPAMGDGGLSIGGVWDYLHSMGNLTNNKKYSDMYLDPRADLGEFDLGVQSIEGLPDLVIEENEGQSRAKNIARLVNEGQIVGLMYGSMEFGPRALLHRSIIADPRNKEINNTLNRRLRRTEFMPFAPVCRFEDASTLFHIDNFKDMTSFQYMTMTCGVRENWIERIPAVVHVDKTARPQILPKNDSSFASEILTEFKYQTGIPCLINTSFNVHEEPIVRTLNDGIRALQSRAVDWIATENRLIKIKS